MSSEFRSPLDDEIDDVARSLTAGAPSAALRSVISARVAAHSGVARAWCWSLAVAAASAVLILTIVWPEHEPIVNAPVAREEVATTVPPRAVDQLIDPQPTLGSIAPRALPGSSGESDRARPIDEEVFPGEPTAVVGPLVVEPLKDLDPIGLDGIEVSLLTVDAMTISPLSQQ